MINIDWFYGNEISHFGLINVMDSINKWNYLLGTDRLDNKIVKKKCNTFLFSSILLVAFQNGKKGKSFTSNNLQNAYITICIKNHKKNEDNQTQTY